ncbi:peptidyl-tRNA hydrolase [Williamsia sp. 1138]|uniref:aminoacyl-tRNA hydrolase n=1 Tax=Williamsia sp. 1138 TaxID=1903117 RepID=UPI000A102408|nr:aminoacyl-tRNA hydrolase [Williamsia sp. 1138]OZG28598.1 peptidyl-tRNA hydrolase [Williamsia sp. 1138]
MDSEPVDASEAHDAEARSSTFAERYDRLVGYVGGHSDPEDPRQVLAMQMVLHIPKAEQPDRTDLLNAAASAVALLCLDERSGGDGPWAGPMDAWCDARIRKIARRARGAHWEAAQDVPGVTAGCGTASARAIVPGPVGETDKRIARLQIGGTEISGEAAGSQAPAGPMLWVNPTLEMTVGKLAAQVGHASMLAVKLMDRDQAAQWFSAGCPVSVRDASRSDWDRLLTADADGTAVAVRDAGFTEIAPGSVTVIAETSRAARTTSD